MAKKFVRYLWAKDLIPLPRNIDSKEYGFKKSPRSIPTMTTDQVRTIIDQAQGQLKLHLLLMLNCGMTQTDIADLRDDEVDWESGRITRKRSKTADHDDVPTVSFPLWPLTFDLLKRYRSGGETVLVTKSGASWAWEKLIDGKYKSSDNIATNYNHLKEKLRRRGFDAKPLKLLRKTGASVIESREGYGRYVPHFLGHSPRSVGEKHYSAPPQKLFDEIVVWLGTQFGF